MRRANSRNTSCAGVASVEFAAVAVVLFFLMQLLIETAWQVATEIALEHGAHDALRFAITGNASVAGVAGAPGCRAGTIVWLVTHGAPGVLKANNLQVSSSLSTGNPVASSAPGFGGAASQTVKYIFSYNQPYVTPFAKITTGAAFFPHSVSIAAENEPYPTQPC